MGAVSNYGPAVGAAFDQIRVGAGKADFWRYLVMYRDGGAYFDTDTACKEEAPLDSFVDPASTYITGMGYRGDFHQWGLIAAPGSSIFKKCISYVLKNVENRNTTTHWRGLWKQRWDAAAGAYRFKSLPYVATAGGIEGFAGPPLLMKAAMDCLTDPAEFELLRHGFRFCNGDLFGNRVVLKAPGLKKPTWRGEKSPFRRLSDAPLPVGEFSVCAPILGPILLKSR